VKAPNVDPKAAPGSDHATFEGIVADLRVAGEPAISRLGAATAALRAAELELRDALVDVAERPDPAWRRYVAETDHAMVEMESQLTIAAARLRAELASTRDELRQVLDTAGGLSRARLDNLNVQVHLGERQVRDATRRRVEALRAASHRINEVVAAADHEAEMSLAQLRTATADALGDLWSVLGGLASSLGPERRADPARD